MLLTKTVKVKWTNASKKYYEDKGYIFTNLFDDFEINVEDLKPTSKFKVQYLCDYCLEDSKETIITQPYSQYYNTHHNQTISKDCCKSCGGKKRKESNLINYGVENTMQLLDIKKKIQDALRLDFEYIRTEFEKRDLILLTKSDEYKSSSETKFKYRCNKHPYIIQEKSWDSFNQGCGCKLCGNESRSRNHKKDISIVKQVVLERGYTLLSYSYNDRKFCLDIQCKENHEFTMLWNNFKKGQNCPICTKNQRVGEGHWNWQGGITPLHNHLRNIIRDWKFESLKQYNFRCAITNIKPTTVDLIVHHEVSFSDIINETINILGLDIRMKVSDYSDEELEAIECKCLELHNTYGYGVPLLPSIHDLFHQQYGQDGTTTREDFEEFKRRYYNGEFNEIFKGII